MAGLCECGCGEVAPIATETRPSRGNIKGKPQRFILGHFARTRQKHDLGTRQIVKGYVHVYMPSHSRADSKGYVAEHIAVAQQALGKLLPASAVVHHVNRNRRDNRPANLVICQDASYHGLLHRRMRVKARGGNPNTDAICSRCGVRPISAFYVGRNGIARDCKECAVERARKYSNHKPWRPGGMGRPPNSVARKHRADPDCAECGGDGVVTYTSSNRHGETESPCACLLGAGDVGAPDPLADETACDARELARDR